MTVISFEGDPLACIVATASLKAAAGLLRQDHKLNPCLSLDKDSTFLNIRADAGAGEGQKWRAFYATDGTGSAEVFIDPGGKLDENELIVLTETGVASTQVGHAALKSVRR